MMLLQVKKSWKNSQMRKKEVGVRSLQLLKRKGLELGVLWCACYIVLLQGNQLFKEGKYESAVERYTQALQLDPDSPVILANRAMALLKLSR